MPFKRKSLACIRIFTNAMFKNVGENIVESLERRVENINLVHAGYHGRGGPRSAPAANGADGETPFKYNNGGK